MKRFNIALSVFTLGLVSLSHAQSYRILDTPFDAEINTAAAQFGYSKTPKIDANGKNIAFISTRRDLIKGNPNSGGQFADVILINQQTNQRRLLTVGIGGPPNGSLLEGPEALAISGDGRTVAFVSNARNLDSSDYNNRADCFFVKVDDNLNIVTPPQMLPRPSREALDCLSVAVNFDGTQIAYAINDTAFSSAVFRFNVATNEIQAVSSGLANRYNSTPSINANNEIVWVQATSSSSKIISSTRGLINAPSNSGYSASPAISSSGAIAFSANRNLQLPVFVNQQILLNVGLADSTVVSGTSFALGNGISRSPRISAATNEVVFETQAQNLDTFPIPDQNGNIFDIVLLGTQGMQLVNLDHNGSNRNTGQVTSADISADGRYIAYNQDGGSLLGNPATNIGGKRVILVDRGRVGIEAFGPPAQCGDMTVLNCRAIRWNAQAGMSYYEVQQSSKPNFANASTTIVYGNSSYQTINSYVRVRGCRVDGGVTTCGPWSAAFFVSDGAIEDY